MITAQAKIDTGRICERALERLRVREYERLSTVFGKRKQQELAKTLGAAHVGLELLRKWITDASMGDKRNYFVTSVERPLSVARRDNAALDCLSSVAHDLAQAGYVTLVQQHGPTGEDLVYEMRRTGKGFAPYQAKFGRLGSSPSPAYGGIKPRIDADGSFTLADRHPIMGQPRPNMDESTD